MLKEDLWIDLSDIKLDDLEVLAQPGARGIPEFAASSGQSSDCNVPFACSCCCGMEDPSDTTS
jgi:hypothetical protein